MSAHGHTAALRTIRALLATEDARGWNASGLHMTVDACRSVCEEALEAPRAPHGAGGSRVEGTVERRGAEGKPPPAAPGCHCTATEVCFPCRDREAHPKPEPPWLGPDAGDPSEVGVETAPDECPHCQGVGEYAIGGDPNDPDMETCACALEAQAPATDEQVAVAAAQIDGGGTLSPQQALALIARIKRDEGWRE